MPTTDPRVDAYLAKAPEFARPILAELRARVHRAVPAVTESIKWSVPFFLLDGRILASMAAFKAHTKFNLWGGGGLVDGKNLEVIDLRSVGELPAAKAFGAALTASARKVATGEVKMMEGRRAKAKTGGPMPAALRAALAKNAKAKAAFSKLSPSHQREYSEWIASAKREETTASRVSTTLNWVTQGKSRNWKYDR